MRTANGEKGGKARKRFMGYDHTSRERRVRSLGAGVNGHMEDRINYPYPERGLGVLP